MLRIGKAIKELRLLRCLSLNDIAKKTGLNKSYLSTIENEKREPSLHSLAQISKAINVPLYILIFMAEEKTDTIFSELNGTIHGLLESKFLLPF